MPSATRRLIDNWGRTPEERAEESELAAAANAEAASRWDDPAWRREVAAVLTESIWEGFNYESFYDQVIETRRVGFDDRVIMKEKTGLKVFSISKGGHIEASALVSEVMEIGRDTLGFHVYEFEDKLKSGFAESIADLRSLAVKRLDWGMNKQIKNLIEAALYTPSLYYTSASGLSQNSLNEAIRRVRDESTTGAVTLYGRSTMVDQICDFTGFADEALEEIRARGRLGTYRGATVVQVRNWKDEDGTSYIPANELYVVGRDAGLFAMYGGLLYKEYVENDNWYWHYLGRQDYGGVLHHPERAHRFVDTNINP